MSIYCMAVNTTKREYLNPGDLGININIISIENNSNIFHLALVRLLENRWYGDNVCLATEGKAEYANVYEKRYKNIAEEVFRELKERHRPSMDSVFGGDIKSLNQNLKRYRKNALAEELEDLSDL